MRKEKGFVEKYITLSSGKRVKAVVPPKLTPEERKRVYKKLLRTIAKIAESQKSPSTRHK